MGKEHVHVFKDAAGDWRWTTHSAGGVNVATCREGLKNKRYAMQQAQKRNSNAELAVIEPQDGQPEFASTGDDTELSLCPGVGNKAPMLLLVLATAAAAWVEFAWVVVRVTPWLAAKSARTFAWASGSPASQLARTWWHGAGLPSWVPRQ
jgi:hypothetical protein